MIRVRPSRDADFETILRVQREAFSEYLGTYTVTAWTSETIENLKRDVSDKTVLVAEWDGTVVGSIRFWVVGGVCVIRLLSVSPHYQGRGIGKALMEEVERHVTEAHKLYVCTMLRTSRNVSLFLKLGYRPESLLPQHFNRMDMICFAKYRTPRS